MLKEKTQEIVLEMVKIVEQEGRWMEILTELDARDLEERIILEINKLRKKRRFKRKLTGVAQCVSSLH